MSKRKTRWVPSFITVRRDSLKVRKLGKEAAAGSKTTEPKVKVEQGEGSRWKAGVRWRLSETAFLTRLWETEAFKYKSDTIRSRFGGR